MLRSTQELIKFGQGDALAPIHVKFIEHRLKAVESQEFFSVDACHHELTVRDEAVLRVVSHLDEGLHLLFIEVATVVLAVALDQLVLGEMAVSRGIELLEDLLQLLGIADVHEMLHEVTEGSLLDLVF